MRLRLVPLVLLVLGAALPAAAQDAVFENGFEDCPAQAERACYTGPAGTAGTGTCRAGTQRCEAGGWSACSAERTPLHETCNAFDDDCDGPVDESLGSVSCGLGACRQTVAACNGGLLAVCTPGMPVAESCDGVDNDCDGAIDESGCACVHVAPTGLDANAGSASSPMRTIVAAIARAAQSGPPVVCVASGVVCGTTANFDEAVVMADGVHVYGGYQQAGTTWTRNAACVTRIRAQNATGVLFGASVAATTILDGFQVTGSADATNAAVTVQGSTGAVLTNLTVAGGSGTTSVGVDVSGGATPVIAANAIVGGTGTALAIGVRSTGSAPRIESNCASTDASGRCTSSCSGAMVTRGIRGRAAASSGTATDGVRLDASPGAVVERNAICGTGPAADTVGLRIAGDAAGTTLRGNAISGLGGTQRAFGVWAQACGGAAPWLVDNSGISGASATSGAVAQGVRAEAGCDPRIDANVRIVGGAEGSAAVSTGVLCARDAASGAASRCTVTDNVQVLGSAAGAPPESTGMRCEDGACALVAGNDISGRGGVSSTGLALGAGGVRVEANVIRAGCATQAGVGLRVENGRARVENNRIEGSSCVIASAAASTGVHLALGAGLDEVDFHSNDVAGQLGGGSCTSRGVALATLGAPPARGRGALRNNIVSAGACSTATVVEELDAGADPRVLRNNDLWSPGPATLYRDEAATDLGTIAAIEALTDVDAGANLSADPQLTPEAKLGPASPCRDAGAPAGAPAVDFEGDARPEGAGFDCGRDEYVQ